MNVVRDHDSQTSLCTYIGGRSDSDSGDAERAPRRRGPLGEGGHSPSGSKERGLHRPPRGHVHVSSRAHAGWGRGGGAARLGEGREGCGEGQWGGRGGEGTGRGEGAGACACVRVRACTLLCDPTRASKGAEARGAQQTRLARGARAMLPQLWAWWLCPLFLARLAQPTQKMKVSVPLRTQRTAAPDARPGLGGREESSLVLSTAGTRLPSSADPAAASPRRGPREADSLPRTFAVPGRSWSRRWTEGRGCCRARPSAAAAAPALSSGQPCESGNRDTQGQGEWEGGRLPGFPRELRPGAGGEQLADAGMYSGGCQGRRRGAPPLPRGIIKPRRPG